MVREPVLERAVMDVIWASDAPSTPAEVRDRLAPGRQVAYTTVMTVLVRLWRKGMLDRRRVGRAFAYSPYEPKESFTARRMDEILGSADDRSLVLSRFIDALSDDERAHLRRELE